MGCSIELVERADGNFDAMVVYHGPGGYDPSERTHRFGLQMMQHLDTLVQRIGDPVVIGNAPPPHQAAALAANELIERCRQ